MSRPNWLLVALMLSALLSCVQTSIAAVPKVADEGKFFSPEAIEKANQKLKEIKTEFGKDVLIETFPAVPADLDAKFKSLGKNEFFKQWAVRRAEGVWIEGIYVLLCKQPGHLQIEVDKETRAKAFTLADRDRLSEKMLALLKEKKNDAALQEAIDAIQAALRANGVKKVASDKAS